MKKNLKIFLLVASATFATTASANNCQDLMKTFLRKSDEVVTIKKVTPPVSKKEPVKTVVAPKKEDIKYVQVNVKEKLDLRLEHGEVSKKDYGTFLAVTDDFEKRNKAPLMGEGMNECFSEFSGEAAESLVRVVNSTRGAKSSKETFDRLIKGSQNVFGDSPAQAKNKICALSKGNNCKLFSQAIARHCP